MADSIQVGSVSELVESLGPDSVRVGSVSELVESVGPDKARIGSVSLLVEYVPAVVTRRRFWAAVMG